MPDCPCCGDPLLPDEIGICDYDEHKQAADFLGVRPWLTMGEVTARAREKRERRHNEKQEDKP